MKKLLTIALSLSMAAPLAGCGVVEIIQCMGKEQLVVFNWGEYVDESLLDAFEAEYNVCVSYSTYADNETAVTKIQNESVDIVIPSEYAVEQLIKEDRLLPIDWSKITSFSPEDLNQDVKGILDELKNSEDGYDLLQYGVPYFWGNLGILYNPEVVSTDLVVEKQWDIFRQPGYKIAFYNTSRDAFMVALKQLGYSLNTNNVDEINEAKQWLTEQRTLVGSENLAYVSENVIEEMMGDYHDIALVFSGDATYVMQENPKLLFYTPTVGTDVWVDSMVIPRNSKNPDLAHKYIDFMLRYENAKANTMYVGYISPRQDVVEELVDTYFADQSSSYNISLSDKDEIYRYNDVVKAILVEAWAEIKGS